ncbi:uncharacterized protein LOC111319034 [Stylophora pistillata]|uniref:uncharacterized protein LOC111319034 n=1 Tax=Stylophora pistillata TaxID=50429 RepID=UPI000C0513DD|nr:uncharacterized protein LOC111319034 [Stylophora pistillata]
MMLQRHVFKRITGDALSDVCLRECYVDVRCQSFNYVFTQDICELSDRTKEARPEDYVPNPERFYFKGDYERVPLGSIPELPAETCQEIKMSEGGQAVSGKYWFYSIIPDETVLAPCDMKTEGIRYLPQNIRFCSPGELHWRVKITMSRFQGCSLFYFYLAEVQFTIINS